MFHCNMIGAGQFPGFILWKKIKNKKKKALTLTGERLLKSLKLKMLWIEYSLPLLHMSAYSLLYTYFMLSL